MILLVNSIAKDDDVSAKDDDVSTNFIQWVKKFDLLIKYTGNLLEANLTYEELVGYVISVKLTDLSIKLSDLLDNKTDLSLELAISRFFQLLYKEMRVLEVLINPRESTREIIEVIGEHGILSARMITRYTMNDQIRSKNTARKLLRLLHRSGLLDLYPTDPLTQAIDKPLASLHRTELYGFPNLPNTAYNNVINFYKNLTEKAHEDERRKQQVKLDQSDLKMRVDPKDLLNERYRLQELVNSYQKTYDRYNRSGVPSWEAEAPLYKEKRDTLQEKLNEVIRKLEEVEV